MDVIADILVHGYPLKKCQNGFNKRLNRADFFAKKPEKRPLVKLAIDIPKMCLNSNSYLIFLCYKLEKFIYEEGIPLKYAFGRLVKEMTVCEKLFAG